jgi:hypothetical protein
MQDIPKFKVGTTAFSITCRHLARHAYCLRYALGVGPRPAALLRLRPEPPHRLLSPSMRC